MEMSALVKAELAATCSTLGRPHGGRYIVDPQCYESVRDLIRYLRRDEAYHEVRLYLGTAKVLETDLVPIISVAEPDSDLFDIVIRLLVNLTNPVILLYKEEVPAEKVGRNIYLRLLGHSQEYKSAFCDVDFWKAVGAKLTSLFEVDWADRSEDSSLQIERLLVLLRNVLQVPADSDLEKRPDNDITVHDKVLWALRESQLLELLLYVSSNKDEEQYFLHLLEIFSLILREQSPGVLANCEIRRSVVEKEKDTKELAHLREKEKLNSKSFKNTRTFNQTFVLKNVKSISDNEMVYHRSLDKLTNLRLTQDKKRVKTPKNKFPEDSERAERRSTFSVRLFLKEFCIELLSCSFNHLMGVVKDKLVSGKGLSNDESYYFWALRFFLEFSCNANVDIKLISECINVQTFHFVQTQMENCYDRMMTEKKKLTTWVRRLHLALKAYRSLLQTLMWMDSSKDSKIRDISKVLKSNVFYVVEYRELMLNCLYKYDSGKFPLSFLRDLIETNHMNLKLIEQFCKNSHIVIQKKKRVKKCVRNKARKEAPPPPTQKTPDENWNDVKDQLLEMLEKNCDIPEIVPFDAASSVPIDEQKEEAMKNVQRYLRSGDVAKAIGLLRSARQVWPENDCFGSEGMSVEDESMALQEICLTDLGVVYEEPVGVVEDEEDDSEEDEGEEVMEVEEQNFDIQDYIKKLAHRKVVEACCTLLANYKRNTTNTNHAVIKLLHRVGWECKVPAMLYQASFFVTLNRILNEKDPEYKEAQQFAKQLIKKFRENVTKNPKIFMELLFWKDAKIAIEIQDGYGTVENKPGKGVWSEEEEDELKRLWVEFDEKMFDGDKIDWIKTNLINKNRSRIAIIKKLKELMLMLPGEKTVKKKRGGADWSEDETSLLSQLFEAHKNAIDPVQMIRDRMPLARSKKSIRDKLLDMGLVNSLAELRKKRVRKGKSAALDSDHDKESSSEDEAGEQEVDEPETRYSQQSAISALRVVQSMKDELKWIKETFEECLEDDDAAEGYPLLALESAHTDALENADFVDLLNKLGLQEPKGEQMYWKVANVSKMDLHDRLELIKAAIEEKLDEIVVKETRQRKISEDSGSEDEFEKLKKSLPGSKVYEAEKSEESGEEDTVPEPSTRVSKFGSDDETYRSVGEANEKDLPHSLDSDRSDKGGASEDDRAPIRVLKKKSGRPGCLASDSDGEDTSPPDYWRYKRRRCIGSDSEIENNPSDDEERGVVFEVRKKSKILDSDSELDEPGSPVDEIPMSR